MSPSSGATWRQRHRRQNRSAATTCAAQQAPQKPASSVGLHTPSSVSRGRAIGRCPAFPHEAGPLRQIKKNSADADAVNDETFGCFTSTDWNPCEAQAAFELLRAQMRREDAEQRAAKGRRSNIQPHAEEFPPHIDHTAGNRQQQNLGNLPAFVDEEQPVLNVNNSRLENRSFFDSSMSIPAVDLRPVCIPTTVTTTGVRPVSGAPLESSSTSSPSLSSSHSKRRDRPDIQIPAECWTMGSESDSFSKALRTHSEENGVVTTAAGNLLHFSPTTCSNKSRVGVSSSLEAYRRNWSPNSHLRGEKTPTCGSSVESRFTNGANIPNTGASASVSADCYTGFQSDSILNHSNFHKDFMKVEELMPFSAALDDEWVDATVEAGASSPNLHPLFHPAQRDDGEEETVGLLCTGASRFMIPGTNSLVTDNVVSGGTSTTSSTTRTGGSTGVSNDWPQKRFPMSQIFTVSQLSQSDDRLLDHSGGRDTDLATLGETLHFSPSPRLDFLQRAPATPGAKDDDSVFFVTSDFPPNRNHISPRSSFERSAASGLQSAAQCYDSNTGTSGSIAAAAQCTAASLSARSASSKSPHRILVAGHAFPSLGDIPLLRGKHDSVTNTSKSPVPVSRISVSHHPPLNSSTEMPQTKVCRSSVLHSSLEEPSNGASSPIYLSQHSPSSHYFPSTTTTTVPCSTVFANPEFAGDAAATSSLHHSQSNGIPAAGTVSNIDDTHFHHPRAASCSLSSAACADGAFISHSSRRIMGLISKSINSRNMAPTAANQQDDSLRRASGDLNGDPGGRGSRGGGCSPSTLMFQQSAERHGALRSLPSQSSEGAESPLARMRFLSQSDPPKSYYSDASMSQCDSLRFSNRQPGVYHLERVDDRSGESHFETPIDCRTDAALGPAVIGSAASSSSVHEDRNIDLMSMLLSVVQARAARAPALEGDRVMLDEDNEAATADNLAEFKERWAARVSSVARRRSIAITEAAASGVEQRLPAGDSGELLASKRPSASWENRKNDLPASIDHKATDLKHCQMTIGGLSGDVGPIPSTAAAVRRVSLPRLYPLTRIARERIIKERLPQPAPWSCSRASAGGHPRLLNTSELRRIARIQLCHQFGWSMGSGESPMTKGVASPAGAARRACDNGWAGSNLSSPVKFGRIGSCSALHPRSLIDLSPTDR